MTMMTSFNHRNRKNNRFKITRNPQITKKVFQAKMNNPKKGQSRVMEVKLADLLALFLEVRDLH
jgi:hypothetical protein